MDRPLQEERTQVLHKRSAALTLAALAVVVGSAGLASASHHPNNKTSITAVTNKEVNSIAHFSPRSFTVGQNKHAQQPEINSQNPLLLLIMRDESQTMGLPYHSDGRQENKGDAATRGINRLLNDIILRLVRTDQPGQPTIKPYVNVAVIGYNGDTAGNRLDLVLKKRDPNAAQPPHKFIVSLEELMNNPLRVEKIPAAPDADDLEDEIQVFVDNFKPGANTPMRAGMKLAHRIVKKHVDQYPSAHPPLVVNITDGMSTDGSPLAAMKTIRETMTDHGGAIMMNVNISSSAREAIFFPSHEDELGADITGREFAPYAQMLFHGSSQVPDSWIGVLEKQGYAVTNASKALLFNAPIDQIHTILQMGTRATLTGAGASTATSTNTGNSP